MFRGFFWRTSAADVRVKLRIQILSSGIRTSLEYCFSGDFLLLFRTFEHTYLHFLLLAYSKQARYFSFDAFEGNYRSVPADGSPFLLISACSRIKSQSLRLVRTSRHLQLTRMHARLICIRPLSSLRCLHSLQCVTVPIFALSLKKLQEQTSWFSVEPLSDVHVITLLPSLIKDDYSSSFTRTIAWSTRTAKRLDVFSDKWKNHAEKSTTNRRNAQN